MGLGGKEIEHKLHSVSSFVQHQKIAKNLQHFKNYYLALATSDLDFHMENIHDGQSF